MANVVKFGGISIANVQKIFGISKSSISKIMGSTVSSYTYATWNPSDKSSLLTLSGSNLIATHDGSDAWAGIRANIGKSSGKWYWEYNITTSAVNEYALVGVGNSSQVLSDHVGNSTNGWGYYQTDGSKVYNDSLTAYGNTFATGDKIGIALNMDTGKVWFSKNGTWQNNRVISLLHLNGTDGSTTFTDESGRSWTYGGNAQLDTADKKFDTASLLLDGNGDYIKTTTSLTNFYFGSGNFTIDFWTKLNQSKEQVFVGFKPSSGNCLGIGCDASNHLYGYIYQSTTGYYLMSTLSLTADGNWHHVAFVRDGNTLRMFLDGTAASETTAVTGVTMNDPSSQIVIGSAQGADSYYVNGWMDEIRFSAGVARWTGSFSVPTAAYKYSPPADGIDEAFSGLSGTIYPMISMIQHSTVITANFGSSSLSYSPPAGFMSGLYS